MKEKLMQKRIVGMLAAVLLMAARHPTPTVVLIKQTDLIRSTLSGAQQFFVRNVTIGKEDLAQIRKEVDYSPEDPSVKFYLGKDAAGQVKGVVFFPQVNTVHGPIEVGLTLNPDGSIANAAVTQATVETKPWVQEAQSAGLMSRFKGMRYGDDVGKALNQLSSSKISEMSRYEAEVITTAVHHGLVLYHVLFDKGDKS
jgi:hypothetical protein